MTTAKLFMNGRSQAVRLPKAFRFKGDSVEIRQCGDGVLLLPHKPKAWEATRTVAEEAGDYQKVEPPPEQERNLKW